MAYGFTGSYGALGALSQMPRALPRLVECMGRDLRSKATYDGHPLLAGAVCFQGIVYSRYFQQRNQRDWPPGFADSAFVDYTSPSLKDLRAAQRLWREQQLQRDPP